MTSIAQAAALNSQCIKLCIHGAAGKVGRLFPTVISEFPGASLSASLDSRSTPEQRIQSVENSDCVIDFSRPEASLKIAEIAAQAHRPILIATTGHSPAQIEILRAFSKSCAVLLAPNTSLGVHALHLLSQAAQRMLGDSYQIEIVEAHHAAKKDSPSGTALSLANHLRRDEAGHQIVTGRGSGALLRAPTEIGISSVRGGDVFGEHTIYFLGKGERLELIHRASDRALFARGALLLATKLVGMRAGFYSPQDIFN